MPAIVSDDFFASGPTYSRRYGGRYEELSHLSSASLCYREIGKVKVDCRFRMSETRWGMLGECKKPAGIAYMDLGFDQPEDFRLKSATILITLQYWETAESNNNLYITEYFGPKNLRGIPTCVNTKETYHITPNVSMLGNGIGGLGVDKEKYSIQSGFWSFTGQLLPGKSKYNTEAAYRTIKWELTENELERKPSHSNTIHTAFAFQHENEPFIINVEIHGKLQRTRDRLRHLMHVFPPPNKKEQGNTVTVVRPCDTRWYKTSLDCIAHGLKDAMELENHKTIAVQVPGALPVTFKDMTTGLAGTDGTTISHGNHSNSKNVIQTSEYTSKEVSKSPKLLQDHKQDSEADILLGELMRAVQFYSDAEHGNPIEVDNAKNESDSNFKSSPTSPENQSLANTTPHTLIPDRRNYTRGTTTAWLLFIFQLVLQFFGVNSIKKLPKMTLERPQDATVQSKATKKRLDNNELDDHFVVDGKEATKSGTLL